MSAPPSPDHVYRDWHSSSPPPLDASVVGRDLLRAPPQPQQQGGSESGSELDSPPRIAFLKHEDQEPLSPQSPSGLPPSVRVKVANVNPAGYSQEPRSPTSPCSPPSLQIDDVNPAGSPKDSSNDEEENPYFKSLVENFIDAAADIYNATYSDDEIDLAEDQRRSVLYARECPEALQQ